MLCVPVYAQDSPGAAAAAGSDSGSNAKTLDNGLYLTHYTATYSGSSLTLVVDQINNDSFTRTSGTLRLEYWAASTPPGRAQGFTGYRLGVSSTISPMAPRTFYSSLTRTISPYTPPPDGTYTMVLVLAEFDSINCSAADHYCITDSANSDQPRQWIGGVPQPLSSPTTASLENPASGSYQSGIGLISGWSCQGPTTVTVDGVSIAAPYGGPRADTAGNCGGSSNNGFGLLVNYNNFGAGTHTAQLYVNGVARGSPSFFTVTVPSGEYMTGLSKSVTVPNFPSAGRTTTLIWQESQQNFAIQSVFP
jgi:hypothetical protein